MASLEEKIAAAEKRAQEAAKQVKQLKARRDMVEARKLQSLLKGQRSDDTRRKILVGAMVLDMMERDETTRQRFMDRLDKFLTRADDRALFQLPPIPEKIVSAGTGSPDAENAPAAST
jgi:large subunit ribosomal protein L7/L12